MQATNKPHKDVLPLKARSRQCAAAIMDMLPLIGRTVGRAMRQQANLSLTQLKVLFFISQNPGTSVSSAAEDLCVTKPSASDLIDRLVKRGFIRRVEDPQERRKVLLSLTAAGQSHLDDARQYAQACLLHKLDGVSPAELEKILTGIQQLTEAFKEV